MTLVFGEVAEVYDEVRPEYPAEIGPAGLRYRVRRREPARARRHVAVDLHTSLVLARQPG